mmetsp:Transcript_30072/g.63810  ORF Transcript_30072/g.63810 Transcript_30072/m.63810 type:complete len:132 (+) Transcript_30072:168-563(+)
MHEKGVVILLGLPNGTLATQEMDQGYATFKPECQESTIRVAGMELAAQVQVQKDIESKHATSKSPFVLPSVDDLENFLLNDDGKDIDEFLEEGNVDDAVSLGNEEECTPEQIGNQKLFQLSYQNSVCNVTL